MSDPSHLRLGMVATTDPGIAAGHPAARYEALFRVSRAIGAYREPKELFHILASELRQLVRFDFMGVLLYDEASNTIRMPVMEVIQGPGLVLPTDLPVEETITWWVYHHQQPVVISSWDERFPRVMKLYQQFGVESTCCLPLTTVRRRLGCLAFGSVRPGTYSEDEVRFLSLVADQVALAIDNALRNEEQQRSESFLAEGQRLSHTGSWARHLPGGQIIWSQEMLRIFGLDPEGSNPTEVAFLEKIHPEDRQLVKDLRRVALQRKSDFEYECRIIRTNGELRYIRVLGHPVVNDAGELAEFVGTVVDVTEQHEARVNLQRAFDEIKALKDKLQQENVALREEIDQTSMFEEIVGRSGALKHLLSQVETVAPTDSTVLIYGETGTGKELIARAIHNLSARSGRALVKVNCAAIPTGLLESELFGHEKGAFTGAIAQRIGRFELASQGTVFLDEVGEIPLELQPKLLRVLQEKEFERLGSTRTLSSDARLIAATNRNLTAMVDEQKFRSDLFYRLNVFPIRVPALRERPEDIPLLVQHFVQQFARRIHRTIESIPSSVMKRLCEYSWPGNIRELQNVIERAVILSSGPILQVSMADLTIHGALAPENNTDDSATGRRRRLRRLVEETDRNEIVRALNKSAWQVGGPDGAAAHLGLKRTTLLTRMKKLGIHRDDVSLSK